MAIWRFYSAQGEDESLDGSCDESIEVTRLKVPGAPVFSLAKIPEVLPDGTIVRKRPKPPGIYLGTASKEVLTWMLGSKDVTDKVVLDGHTGWVRSLAVTGKWLFSCGCNYLRLWDTNFRTPKECDSARLFTGDILAIAASDGRVFTVGADGSLRSWSISRAGDLQEGPSRDKAHDGRVSACAISGGRVFTVSYDGSIKAWEADTLGLVAEVRGAHNGDKIFCTAVGANGVLFTGGDDKLVRAWDQDLNPVGVPLEGHGASVRVLSAGRRALLVSGDADGDVCIWETYPVDLPSSSSTNQAAAAAEAAAMATAAPSGDGLEALGGGFAAAAVAGAAAVQEEAVLAESHQQHQLEEGGVHMAAEVAVATPAYDPCADPVAALESQAAAEASNEEQQQLATAFAAEQATAILHASDHQEQLTLEQQQAYYALAPEHQQQQDAYYASEQQQEQEQPAATEPQCPPSVQDGEQCRDFPGAAEWQQQQQGYCTEPAEAAAVVAAAAVLGADVEGFEHQRQHLDADDSTVSPSPVELVVGGVMSADTTAADADTGAVAAAAPTVHANGSGGFAVMAATVSEDTPLDDGRCAAVLEAEAVEEEQHHFCQIEVESVAAAVAAACLAKDVDSRVTTSGGAGAAGRVHHR